MKRLIFLLLPFLLCGCSRDMNRREIDEVNFIHALGIDYADGEYTISAIFNSGGGADPEGSGEAGSEEISNGTGKTPYAAYEDLRLKNKKAITLTQAGFFLIGDTAAKEGIDLCLDFLSRNETIKLESLIYVTKGEKAEDFINAAIENKQAVSEDLEAIKQKQQEIITRNDNNLVNILNEMKQNYSSVLIPYLTAEESGFLIEGYAIFDQLKLYDYLDKETSSGINFMKNIVRSYPIHLENGTGLSISYTDTDLKTKLENDKIIIKIKVNFESMIKEVNMEGDTFTYEVLSKLTKEQNQYVENIIRKAADYSVTTGLDILQLARIIENQNVSQWRDLKETWEDNISKIEFEYELNSRIVKSFILGKER
ncbi:MAG: hypothetical protein K0S76_1181 [Herbinix sp.]|jgi:spore germination protein KC|nr:hypothetical protein [Herbinix sp.]